MSRVMQGAPVFFNMPQFGGADASVKEMVEFNKDSPLGERSVNYIDVEPYTGISIGMNINSGASVQIGPTHLWYTTTAKHYYPLYSQSVHAAITKELVDDINTG